MPQTPTLTDPDRNLHKKPGHYSNQCRLLKTQREQSEDTQINFGNKTIGANNSIPNNNTNQNVHNNNYSSRAERKPTIVYPPCETCGKTNNSTDKGYYRTKAVNRPPLRHSRPKNTIRSMKETIQMTRTKLLRLYTRIQTENSTPSLPGCDRQTGDTKLPPIPEIVWQQTPADSFI